VSWACINDRPMSMIGVFEPLKNLPRRGQSDGESVSRPRNAQGPGPGTEPSCTYPLVKQGPASTPPSRNIEPRCRFLLQFEPWVPAK
jgi:hypothetical protein